MRFGIIPAAISPYVVRAIGERQAYRYFQTAERIGAARAREIGLAHEVAEPDALDAAVQAIVDALLAGGPLAQAAATDLVRAVANRPVDEGVVEDTARRIAALRATAEAREGLGAFLDKRPPRVVGLPRAAGDAAPTMFSKILVANRGESGRPAAASAQPDRLGRAAPAGGLAPVEVNHV